MDEVTSASQLLLSAPRATARPVPATPPPAYTPLYTPPPARTGAVAAPGNDARVVAISGVAMTLAYSVQVEAEPADRSVLVDIVEAVFAVVDSVMNSFNESSELTALNRDPRTATSLAVSPTLGRLITRALELHAASGGYFDVSLMAAMQFWTERLRAGTVPSVAMVDAAALPVGLATLHWDPARLVLRKDAAGAALDLNGIAKGAAVDAIVESLAAHGFGAALVSWAGDLRAVGLHPAGRPWTVSIALPPPASSLFASWTAGAVAVSLSAAPPVSFSIPAGCAVATSGDYERLQRFGHTHFVHPRTRSLVRIGEAVLASATVLASDAATADALATAVMVVSLVEAGEARPAAVARVLAYCRGLVTAGVALGFALYGRGGDADTKLLACEGLETGAPAVTAAAAGAVGVELARFRHEVRRLPAALAYWRPVDAAQGILVSSALPVGERTLALSLEGAPAAAAAASATGLEFELTVLSLAAEAAVRAGTMDAHAAAEGALLRLPGRVTSAHAVGPAHTVLLCECARAVHTPGAAPLMAIARRLGPLPRRLPIEIAVPFQPLFPLAISGVRAGGQWHSAFARDCCLGPPTLMVAVDPVALDAPLSVRFGANGLAFDVVPGGVTLLGRAGGLAIAAVRVGACTVGPGAVAIAWGEDVYDSRPAVVSASVEAARAVAAPAAAPPAAALPPMMRFPASASPEFEDPDAVARMIAASWS